MKNFIAPGENLDFTAPAGGVVSGAGVKIGNVFGFATISAAAGDKFPLKIRGVFGAPTDTGTAWAEGDVLYWDDANKVLTKTANGNFKVGAAVVAKDAASVTAIVYLPGILG